MGNSHNRSVVGTGEEAHLPGISRKVCGSIRRCAARFRAPTELGEGARAILIRKIDR